jgi:hypothetical protein
MHGADGKAHLAVVERSKLIISFSVSRAAKVVHRQRGRRAFSREDRGWNARLETERRTWRSPTPACGWVRRKA